MFQHNTTLRVRYADTDKMGYVYYGKYMEYLEVARVEALRSLGISYASIEKDGVMLPVRRCKIDYLKPILYDQQITICSIVKKMPSTKIEFEYEIYNSDDDLVTTATTLLVFVDGHKKRPCLPPDKLMTLMQKHVNNKKN